MFLPNPTHGHQVTAGESGTRMADEQHGMSLSVSESVDCLNMP